jgi:hypothetical protein
MPVAVSIRLQFSSLLAHTSGLPPILPSLVYLKKNSDDEYRYYDRHLIDSALVHWSSIHPMGRTPTNQPLQQLHIE